MPPEVTARQKDHRLGFGTAYHTSSRKFRLLLYHLRLVRKAISMYVSIYLCVCARTHAHAHTHAHTRPDTICISYIHIYLQLAREGAAEHGTEQVRLLGCFV